MSTATALSPTARIVQSSLPIATALELIADVLIEIAGNDISSSLNGESVSRPTFQGIALQELRKELKKKISASA